MVTTGNIAELEKRFLSRIQFSTAGLRGRMTAGFSMMNDVVIIQTSQVCDTSHCLHFIVNVLFIALYRLALLCSMKSCGMQPAQNAQSLYKHILQTPSDGGN